MAEKYKANQDQEIPKMSQKDKEKEGANEVLDTIGKEAGSKYLQAHGVPAPLADMASSKVMDSKVGKLAKNTVTKNPIARKALNKAKPALDMAKPILDAKKGGKGMAGKASPASSGGTKKPFEGKGMPSQASSSGGESQGGMESLTKNISGGKSPLSMLGPKQNQEITGMRKFIEFVKKNPWVIKVLLVAALIAAIILALCCIYIAINDEYGMGNVNYSTVTEISVVDSNGTPLGIVTLEELVLIKTAYELNNTSSTVAYMETIAIAERSNTYLEDANSETFVWTNDPLYVNIDNINSEIKTAVSNTSGKVLINNEETITKISYIEIIIDGTNKNSGVNKSQALELATQGKTVSEIYQLFYGESYQVGTAVKAGLMNVDGFEARISKPEFYSVGDSRNNPFYYSSLNAEYPNLMGECVWYAYGRANEILGSIGSTDTWTYWGNGGSFCDMSNTNKNKYQVTTDYTQPLPGSLVSWKSSSYGHVAVIETVHYDENKNVIGVSVSEGGMGLGYYSRRNGRYWFSVLNEAQRSNFNTRNYNCNTYNGPASSGCFNYSEYVSIDTIRNYSGQFQCYIYLTAPK